MTLLKCSDGLIGDFLGVMPLMADLRAEGPLEIEIHPEAEALFRLFPKSLDMRLKRLPDEAYDRVLNLDISAAFTISHQRNYYMSQAHFACLGRPVPDVPPKAALEYSTVEVPVCDYVIAPFSRSLPPQERWPAAQWQDLIDTMPDLQFCLIGHDRDDPDFVSGPNVTQFFGHPLESLISLLKAARKGLISIVSGPSHLAFHLSVPNVLLTNQHMTWGNNPDAIQIWDPIPKLQARDLIPRLP